MRFLILFSLAAMAAAAQSDMAIRRAVNRALPPIQKSAAAFIEKRACFSCHHNALTLLMIHEAKRRDFPIDSAVFSTLRDKTFASLTSAGALDNAVEGSGLSDPTPNDSLLLMAAGVSGSGLHVESAASVYARRIARWQRPDGHWITSDFRPPHSSSYFTATATAIRALDLYGADDDKKRIPAARRWLFQAKPHSTEDAAFRVMGLVWAKAPESELGPARSELLAMSARSGGWPELPGYPPDAYSTGESLYALLLAHSLAPPVDNGIRFLLSSQAADGSWHVRTRMLSPADVSPRYFTTGFPYGKDEYISYAGSVWAAMGLLAALPEHIDTSAADTESSSASPTAHETTLLMQSADNPTKVRHLLAEGANPGTRTKSGVDALSIACMVRGTAASVKALLDAGADPNPPAKAPLLFASMTGDTENVQLLLSHGARPSAAALSQAITFGYPEIVRMLIEAGADPKITESSGINLLHWATIADRANVVPILAAAGVSINAQDEHGFTPLMYAATIDFGDTATLEALLKAGADPGIRNEDGRNAIEQAHHFGHVNLEAALRKSKR